MSCRGYMPPEYTQTNLISKKFDIYSLGVVMIRTMVGYEGYFQIDDLSSQEFINLVRNFLSNTKRFPDILFKIE
jgi:serine/threonine protein kinase